MSRYAQGTTVPPSKSQGEIAALLRKHGATKTAVAQEDRAISVFFEIEGHRVRIRFSLPTIGETLSALNKECPRGWWHRSDRERAAIAQRRAEQAERERWRQLLLVIKAKLELVAEGVSTIEREFLADMLLESGQTVGEWLGPKLSGAEPGLPQLPPGEP